MTRAEVLLQVSGFKQTIGPNLTFYLTVKLFWRRRRRSRPDDGVTWHIEGRTAEIGSRCADASLSTSWTGRRLVLPASVLLSPLPILFSEPMKQKFILFCSSFFLHPTLSALISVDHPPPPFPFCLLIFLFMILLMSMASAAAQCAGAISELFDDRVPQPRCPPHSCLAPKHICAHLHACLHYCRTPSATTLPIRAKYPWEPSNYLCSSNHSSHLTVIYKNQLLVKD